METIQPDEVMVEAEPVQVDATETSEPASPKDKLVQKIITCVTDGKSCQGLGASFIEAATELGVPPEKLIREVFDQLGRE